MLKMRFSVLVRDQLISEEDLPHNLAGFARQLDFVEFTGGLAISDEHGEFFGWTFMDLAYVMADVEQGLDALFLSQPIMACSPGLTIHFRSVGDTVIVDDGKKHIGLPRRAFLREVYDLCRRFTDFWAIVAGGSERERKRLKEFPGRYIELFGGAVRKPQIVPVVAEIRATSPSAGSIDFLVGDTLVQVEGLHDIMDGVARLSGGIAQLREGQPIVAVVLGRNTLWLTQQKVGDRQCVGICYREVEAGLVEGSELDVEWARAASSFNQRPAAERMV